MTFADDALNLALAKFGLNARALRDARGSGSYLKSISGSAVFEERRQITRRSKQGPYYWEPIEKPNPEEPEGTAINILDFESSRQAAERYLSFSPCFQPDGKRLEHHDIVEKLLHDLTTSSCGREREAAKWLRLIVEHDATIEEIAMLGGITESAARNRLKTAKRKMHELAITRYKFTRGDL